MTGPSAHALLSPSSAHRWISCPASVRLAEQIPKPPQSTSWYAVEGTIAHALGEIEVSYAFGLIDAAKYAFEYEAWRVASQLDLDTVHEIEHHIEGYVAFVKERAAIVPGTRVMVERRVNTGVPKSWGTSDIILFSPEHVEVIDLKYGQGHRVLPENNEQLMLYGLGALDEVALIADPGYVTLSIYQPRTQDGINSWTVDIDVLLKWRDEVAIPQANLALGDDAPFGPSEKACQWCPAAGDCKVRAQFLAGKDFGAPYVDVQTPDLLDGEEMSTVLERLPQIRKWADAVEGAALRRMYEEGKQIPGWKSVLTYGRRYITDQEKAVAELVEQTGMDKTTFLNPAKIKGITDLTKILGKGAVDTMLGDLVQKTDGKPAITRDKDNRRSATRAGSASEDFSE